MKSRATSLTLDSADKDGRWRLNYEQPLVYIESIMGMMAAISSLTFFKILNVLT